MTPADPKSPRATTSRPFRWLTGILTGVLLAMLVIGAASRSEAVDDARTKKRFGAKLIARQAKGHV